MQNKTCRHGYISGRVQGVWFRDSARQQAQKLKVTGWVRNIDDGRVEVFACAEQAVLEQFIHWLHQGPPAARVDDVTMESVDWQNYDLFDVRS